MSKTIKALNINRYKSLQRRRILTLRALIQTYKGLYLSDITLFIYTRWGIISSIHLHFIPDGV